MQRPVPVQIGTATWASVSACSSHTLAIRQDGTLWGWGQNTAGQLGNGTTAGTTSVPTQVGTATTWKSVSASGSHVLALRQDGTLWAWGQNSSGQLGNGTTTNSTTPVQVGTATNWASTSTGYSSNLALRTNGTLWAWGSNSFGQLGTITTITTSTTSTTSTTPVQVGTATWASISAGYYHSLGLRSDGTLWAWGQNAAGQLGNGTNTTGANLTPAQVGTATNWLGVSTCNSHVLALRQDGTLWAWGYNSSGQLGDGTTNTRPAPTQVGTDTNWQRLGVGNEQSLALRQDGTLWAWGSNSFGQLGRPSGSTTPVVSLASVLAVSVLSTAAELPGQAVTITGTGFTGASTVTFGGVAASSVTYVSPTQLLAIVPAGVAGSSAVAVSTGSLTSVGSPAFEALQVFRSAAASTCQSTDGVSITGTGGAGTWRYLRLPAAQGGAVVAAIEDTYNLGTVSVGFTALGTGTSAAVRTDKGRAYLDRNFYLTATNQNFPGQQVRVRFFGLSSELSRLQAAAATATATGLKALQYAGANKDCTPGNNDVAGEVRTLAAPATVQSGTDWFAAEVTVADHFSEFYLTGTPAPLPVTLMAFAAAAQGPMAVRLTWTTASEANSARFEVERSLDGVAFSQVGQVTAAGTTATTRTYDLTDTALPAGAAALYYRLRQVDLDGTATYSPVRVVALGTSSLVLFPNPAAHLTMLSGAAPGQVVQIYSALGRLVLITLADAAGTVQLALPAELPSGVYVVRVGQQALRLAVE